MDDEKPLYWVGSSLADLRALPAEVKDVFGFALHVFQKKSKRGIKTPKPDLDLIKQRLKLAEAWYHKLIQDDE